MVHHRPALYLEEEIPSGAKVLFYHRYPGLYASEPEVLCWLETWPQADSNHREGKDFQKNKKNFHAIKLDSYTLLILGKEKLQRLFELARLDPITADWLTTDIWIARQMFKDKNFVSLDPMCGSQRC